VLIAHRLTEPVELSAGGGKWRIVFTHRVLLDLEELTGLDAMRLNLSGLSALVLRAVLFAALREAGSPLSIEEAGALLRPGSFVHIREALIGAWTASFPDPDPSEQDASSGIQGPLLTTLNAWAKARFDLRLTDEEWLAMTPRMLHALSLRNLDAMRQRELMLATLCAHTVNSSFHAPKSPTQPASYMLHPWPEPQQEPVYGETIMLAFADIPKG
jgi:hypothetical protein